MNVFKLIKKEMKEKYKICKKKKNK